LSSRTTSALVACGALLAARPAFALDPIDTDGPDFVESSEAVPKDSFQYEIDFTSIRDRRSSTRLTTFSAPALLKYGISDRVELRVAPEGYVREGGRSGAGDTAIGLKWHSQDRDPDRGAPSVSWILHVDTPSGSPSFRGTGLRPSLRSVMTWDLPHELALGVMPGIKYDTDGDGHRFTSAIFGAVLNRKVTEQFRAFIEASVPQVAHARNGGVIASWDVGAALLLGNDAQIGVRMGVAANRNTPSDYVLFEVAQRF
jgi:hypothetical protein